MAGAKEGQGHEGGRASPRTRVSSWGWIFMLVGMLGCGPLLSKESLKAVDRELTFSEVIEDPDSYVGSTVLWGGTIGENIPEPEGTKVVVTQAPLDRRGFPQIETTFGEFIAHTPLYLDPGTYRSGRKITIAGEIEGVEETQSGPMEYPRPVLKVLDMYLWDEKLWGVFPLTRGWKVDQEGPVPSPFTDFREEGSWRRTFP